MLLATGLAVVFSMNIWHKVVIQGLPALSDLLIALFGQSSTTASVSMTTTDSNGGSTLTQRKVAITQAALNPDGASSVYNNVELPQPHVDG